MTRKMKDDHRSFFKGRERTKKDNRLQPGASCVCVFLRLLLGFRVF